jgi:methylmalonyl-CoA mutase
VTFNDDGVTALYQAILPKLKELGLKAGDGTLPRAQTRHSTHQTPIVPPSRVRYLAEISETVRGYKRNALKQARLAREVQQLQASKDMLKMGDSHEHGAVRQLNMESGGKAMDSLVVAEALDRLAEQRAASLDKRSRKLLEMWPQMQHAYAGDEYVVKIRGRELRTVPQRTGDGRCLTERDPDRAETRLHTAQDWTSQNQWKGHRRSDATQ